MNTSKPSNEAGGASGMSGQGSWRGGSTSAFGINIVAFGNSNIASTNDNVSSSTWTLKCTDLPQFDALQAQADLFRSDDKLHLRNLCNDSARCAGLSAIHYSNDSRNQHRRMILDYSRQRVMGETMDLLFDLADAVGLTDRRESFRLGSSINITSRTGAQPVLHFLLRRPEEEDDNYKHHFQYQHDGAANNAFMASQLRQIWTVRKQVAEFTKRVHNGTYSSSAGLPFLNTLVICSSRGGYQSGPECVAGALESCGVVGASPNAKTRQLRFLSCCDPTQVERVTRGLNPAETLVILVLLDYTAATAEGEDVVLNAHKIQSWLMQHYSTLRTRNVSKEQVLANHFCAVLGPDKFNKCQQQFGIRRENMFACQEWVNPRYSLCSAAGLLPLSLQFSTKVMDQVLEGAHDMDEHFFYSALRDNIPILLGLLGVWNSTFLGYSNRVILPYADGLRLFPGHVQQVDMESNGKRVALDGTPLLHRSGEINVTTAPYIHQQSLFQLLHQGRVIPADFIGFMQSSNFHVSDRYHDNDNGRPQVDDRIVSHHDELMARFFSEPDALAYGKTLVDLTQEGTPESLREHMVMTGNRPSSSLLLTQLDAFSMGQLLALYEHRTAVQGFIWGINSFDQFGMELGRNLAKTVRAQLIASRQTGASVQGFNSSTSALLEHYLAHGKRLQQQRQQNE